MCNSELNDTEECLYNTDGPALTVQSKLRNLSAE